MLKKIALLTVSIIVMTAGLAATIAWPRVQLTIAAEKRVIGGEAATRKTDLNSASLRELEKLPGMGTELAERVIRHRPYRKLDELIARKVLGRKQFARIKDRVRVDSSPQ